MDAGLPGTRTALAVRRDWVDLSCPEVGRTHTRIFLSSLPPEEKTRTAAAVRGHWSVENLNHYKRDASAWQEDDHRHRRTSAAQNLALTRNALLALIPFGEGEPLPLYFENYHRSPAQAIKLILHSRPLP